MFALGLLTWLFSRPVNGTLDFLDQKFSGRPELAASNKAAFTAGHIFGENTEAFAVRYQVAPAPMASGSP